MTKVGLSPTHYALAPNFVFFGMIFQTASIKKFTGSVLQLFRITWPPHLEGA